VTKEDVLVSEGYFTVQLDFGAGVFINEGRWLEAAVRPGGSTGGYTTLSPRQALTPAPYAHYSSSAGSVPWSGLTGVPAGFADGVDNDTQYSPGTGLNLSVTTFSADTAYLQRRVGSYCSAGSSIRVINNDGTVTCETDDNSTNFWGLSGTSGTNPLVHYVGTSDNQGLVLRVNATHAFRLEPTTGTPNIVGGDFNNTVTPGVVGATISGGGTSSYPNHVTDNYGTVGGGIGNQAGDNAGTTSDASVATVGGGAYNIASGDHSAVGGGGYNEASGYISTVGGGLYNEASGDISTVGGGGYNIASGVYSTVGGGYDNIASGDYSFAAGRKAHAVTQGAFVWADSNNFDFSSISSNSFRARATNGFRLVTGIDDTGAITWSCSFLNGTSWSCSSDRNMKENFQSVDNLAILEKLSNIPLQTWNAKGTDPNVKHLGPTAQDFYSAFGLGDDDKMIATIDLDGVALTAIQGLYQLSQEQAEEIQSLKTELAQMDKAEGNPANDRLAVVWVGISGFLAILVTVQAGIFFTLRRRMGGQA
jgi:hypothetical protein